MAIVLQSTRSKSNQLLSTVKHELLTIFVNIVSNRLAKMRVVNLFPGLMQSGDPYIHSIPKELYSDYNEDLYCLQKIPKQVRDWNALYSCSYCCIQTRKLMQNN